MTEPTHHSTYNGPVFNQNGGQNIGVNYGYVGAVQDSELRAAVEELKSQLRTLTAHLTPEQARTVEETLPVLALDREAMTERGLTLARLSQIANSLGPVAQPVADALGRLLGLLG
ncbi:hypothetical protein N7925_24085 [Streptomyces sp. CA-278952]|uniref:hypothetical protein n=1 Tax=Streptomyces sp. CA-278952 TaxID=2980556 RepID=UPI002368AD54|nr:hypothetical protein [Streptomyces sp. CA-278952]WDG31186.1 hypothetical protein N7925_24085 [Streptomyces sp. CA-278952]